MGKKVFFADWEKDGRFQMIADFANVYMSKEEYEAGKAPYPNTSMWLDTKEKMASALADPKFSGDVLFAAYTYEDYSGDAFVLFRREGKLYEVNGSHCSCYGLGQQDYSGSDASQWEPEETSKEVILRRLDHDYGIFGQFKDQIRAAVESVDA